MGEISVVESDHGQFYSLANIEVDPSDKYNSNPTNEKIPNQIGTDEVSRLMAQVNDLEQEKRGIQRLLKSENHDLADKELDLEQLRNKLKKKQREYDLLNDNHEELKQLMSDLSERYKEVVREGNIIANREKGLLEQLEFQEEERQKLFNTQKVANKEKKNLEDELETTNVKHQILLKKLEAFEKYEIELIQTSHEHAHQLEEAYFARDAALQKASTTQKQVESLSDKLNSQPKFYQEKHEVAMEK